MTLRRGAISISKAIAYQVLRLVPDRPLYNRLVSQAHYFFLHRKFLRPDDPQTFNDFLLRIKLRPVRAQDPMCRVSDKAELKNFVQERLGPGFTPHTYAVLKSPDEIARYEFPLPCVVKPTHASGQVLFLDNAGPNEKQRKEIVKWLRVSHFIKGREPNYKHLQPRIIVEESLKAGNQVPWDLKVHCFQGCPHLMHVIFDRFGKIKRTFYDMRGQRLAVQSIYPVLEADFPFERHLDRVLEISSVLSQGFEYVRVDLYPIQDRLLVGELTFFPENCHGEFDPPEFGYELGKLFPDTHGQSVA